MSKRKKNNYFFTQQLSKINEEKSKRSNNTVTTSFGEENIVKNIFASTTMRFNFFFLIKDYDPLILKDLVEENFKTAHPAFFLMYTILFLCACFFYCYQICI